MRRGSLLALLLLSVVWTAPALAWGTGAHAVIAVLVADAKDVGPLPGYYLDQVVYGAMAPDFAQVAGGPLKGALETATHFAPGYQEPWELRNPDRPAQTAFAAGFLSHNNVWGADYYAHTVSPTTPGAPGYVAERAAVLASTYGVPAGAADTYVEFAIDLLIDQQYPQLKLGGLVSQAAMNRAVENRDLLAKCYGDVPGSSWVTVATLEGAFQLGVLGYGGILALPRGQDDAGVAIGLGVYYGYTVTASARYLAAAKLVCQDPSANYVDAVLATVQLVAAGPWPQ